MADNDNDNGTEWYYNTKTGEVIQGKQEGYIDRMGPYPSREAAAHALDTAKERNKQWDEDED